MFASELQHLIIIILLPLFSLNATYHSIIDYPELSVNLSIYRESQIYHNFLQDSILDTKSISRSFPNLPQTFADQSYCQEIFNSTHEVNVMQLLSSPTNLTIPLPTDQINSQNLYPRDFYIVVLQLVGLQHKTLRYLLDSDCLEENPVIQISLDAKLLLKIAFHILHQSPILSLITHCFVLCILFVLKIFTLHSFCFDDSRIRLAGEKKLRDLRNQRKCVAKLDDKLAHYHSIVLLPYRDKRNLEIVKRNHSQFIKVLNFKYYHQISLENRNEELDQCFLQLIKLLDSLRDNLCDFHTGSKDRASYLWSLKYLKSGLNEKQKTLISSLVANYDKQIGEYCKDL